MLYIYVCVCYINIYIDMCLCMRLNNANINMDKYGVYHALTSPSGFCVGPTTPGTLVVDTASCAATFSAFGTRLK